MGRLVEQARARLQRWAEGQRVTQRTLAQAVGHQQAWISTYFSGSQQADVDELDALARALGHTIGELFDTQPNPQEQLLLELFRSLSPAKRDFAVQMLEQIAPPHAGRSGSRARTGGPPPGLKR